MKPIDEADDDAPVTEGGDDALLREALGMAAQPTPAHLAEGQVIDGAYRIEAEIGAVERGAVLPRLRSQA